MISTDVQLLNIATMKLNCDVVVNGFVKFLYVIIDNYLQKY